jgi:signal transduction histidine kinase
MSASAIRIIHEVKQAIEFSIEEVRNIYMGLRPSLLDDLGILATIRWFIREFRTINPGIDVTAEISIREDEVPEPLKIILFRILQSAMENIVSHSKGNAAAVILRREREKLEFVIGDNGLGFDPLDNQSGELGKAGLGLTCIQERVESSGGTFTLTSTKGRGTTLRTWWTTEEAPVPWDAPATGNEFSPGAGPPTVRGPG